MTVELELNYIETERKTVMLDMVNLEEKKARSIPQHK